MTHLCGDDFGLAVEQTEIKFTGAKQKYDQPRVDLTSEPEVPWNHKTTNLNLGGDSYRENMLDYKFTNIQSPPSENFGNWVSLHVSHSHPLHPRDGNTCVETNSSVQCSSGQSGRIVDSEAGTGSGSSSCFVAVAHNFNMNLMPTASDAEYEMRSIEPAPLSNLDRENIMPWNTNCDSVRTRFAPFSRHNQLVGNVYPIKSSSSSGRVYGGLHSGIRSH
ncbi:hypothetical protein F0562_009463 [Nyssa sinensis]|uniref:Uncharacterized protein n=1 Tax=Nyssa sinensis TaxID=561372 RepID=A0A5J4ZXK7_9ASTE|nr:hypothetical protein F0562_009463 [Nyssa sinensis]